jgi:hypothetical protein
LAGRVASVATCAARAVGGERLDHGAGDAIQVGVTSGGRLPGDPEGPGQLVAERGLVQVAGGLGMPVQRAAVQGRPAPVRALGEVGDQDVGVQQRIPGPAHAMLVAGCQQTAASDSLAAGMPAARPRRRPLQVPQRLPDRGVMRGDDRPDDVGSAEGVQQTHALGRAEGQIEPGHRPGTNPVGKRRAGRGVATCEQPAQPLLGDGSGKREPGGLAADPAAGSFAAAGVVLLLGVSDLVEVVVEAGGDQPADVEHLTALVSTRLIGEHHESGLLAACQPRVRAGAGLGWMS